MDNLNNETIHKTLKNLTSPNGFKIKKENINDRLLLKNHFKINDTVIDEKIFIKFYAHIDPNEKKLKKFSKKEKIKRENKKRNDTKKKK